MTLNGLMREKGLSRYRLSEISGLPWEDLSDICSGRMRFEQCSAETLFRLSKALETSMEELLLLEAESSMDADFLLEKSGL